MPTKKEETFEKDLEKLETLVKKLEDGQIPLEEAISEFQKGMKLADNLRKTLESAEKVLVQLVDETGGETDFKAIPKNKDESGEK